jgi:hypothetical protein
MGLFDTEYRFKAVGAGAAMLHTQNVRVEGDVGRGRPPAANSARAMRFEM